LNLVVHAGITYGISANKVSPVVTILNSIEAIQSFVTMRQLDHIVGIYNIWILPIVTLFQSQEKRLPTTNVPQNTNNASKMSLLFESKISTIKAAVEFARSIGKFTFSLSNLCPKIDLPVRTNLQEAVRSTLTVTTDVFNIFAEGSLDGSIVLESSFFQLQRSSNELIDILIQLSPLAANLSYNVAPILVFKTGLTLINISEKFLQELTTKEQFNLYLNCDETYIPVCKILSEYVDIQISTETISSVNVLSKRIVSSIAEKYKQVNNNNTTVATVEIKQEKPKPLPKVISMGHISLHGNTFNVSFFGFSLKDPSWIVLHLEQYQLLFDQVKRDREIHRQISVGLGNNYISKMVCEIYQFWSYMS
jgi:hypothetical protein